MGTAPVAAGCCREGVTDYGRRCRNRRCKSGNRPWSFDVWSVLAAALKTCAYVRLVVVTAPGADVLPWDLSACTHARGMVCSGRLGCRVDPEAAAEWERGQQRAWSSLINACRERVKRAGYGSPYIALVLEDQRRGVLHWNVVLEEGPAAALYHQALVELAPVYGFGFVDRNVTRRPGVQAAAYLSGYLTSQGGKKARASMHSALGRLDLYRRVWWVSPRLTGHTRVTMGTLRNGRRVWAASEGLIDRPTEGLAVIDWQVIDLSTGAILHAVWDRELLSALPT